MIVARGISFGMPDGTWRKENVSADTAEFDPPDGLTPQQEIAWVSLELEIRLQTLKWFYGGGIDRETLDTLVESYRAAQTSVVDIVP